MRCPNQTCGTENPPGQNFCDECGATLETGLPHTPTQAPVAPVADVQPCSQCGAGPTVIDSDGFCECGLMRVQPARNRIEVLISAKLAGVCDVGCNPLHPENQDFIAAGVEGDTMAGVACDGVSRSQNSAEASEKAAPACLDVLLSGVRAGRADTQALMVEAITAANDAVLSVPYSAQDATDPAASTLAAALVQLRKVTVGWIGDSRVYFVAETGAVYQLSADHSLLNRLLDGGMPLRLALAQEDAHAITRSLGGGGTAASQTPTVKMFNAPGPGYILICTDGLWNYLPETKDLAAVLATLPKAASAVQRAKALVEYARLRGGADNVSVILIAVA